MKKKKYKTVFGLVKKIFIGLLTGIVCTSNHTKCLTEPTLINLHPNEYSQ